MDITAAIVPFNSRNTLWRSLSSLAKQEIPVTLMVFDSGSDDGTEWWVETMRFQTNLADMGLKEVRLLPPIPSKADMFEGIELTNKHLEHALARVVHECRRKPPDAILWLQADVLMPPKGALQQMIDALEADPKLGGIGIRHRVEQDHVPMGCVLYRWEPLTELAEEGFRSNGCPCRWIHRAMTRNGWTVRELDGIEGTHLAEGGSHAANHKVR
jgi:glycosyltransferase involved in cell wall biosynthesis